MDYLNIILIVCGIDWGPRCGQTQKVLKKHRFTLPIASQKAVLNVFGEGYVTPTMTCDALFCPLILISPQKVVDCR